MVNCHVCILFGESCYIFGRFSLVCLHPYCWVFKGSLYILDNSSLSDMFCKIYSLSFAHLLILLTFSFAEWKFLIFNEVQRINYFFHGA